MNNLAKTIAVIAVFVASIVEAQAGGLVSWATTEMPLFSQGAPMGPVAQPIVRNHFSKCCENVGCSDCLAELLQRPKVTGGMFGLVPILAERGIFYKATATNFYQGVTSGGVQQRFRNGTKIDQYFIFDTAKLGLWEGGKLIMHADSNVGQNSIGDAVLLAPVNTAALTPLPDENVTAITHFQFEQELGRGWAATVGKFNFLDLWTALYPNYGAGLDGFMNVSIIAPLNVVPSTPLVFDAAGLLKATEKGITFGLFAIDSRETQTVSGLDGLFSNGCTILALGKVFTDFGGLPGSHLVAGAYATGEFTRFDDAGWLLDIALGVAPLKRGSYLAAYVGEQKLWVHPGNEQRNVGLYGYVGFSDQENSPFDWTTSVSMEAFGPLACREHDRMGVGYFYTGLSEFIKEDLALFGLQDVHGGEIYYNAEITPWCHVTADLQVLQPDLDGQDPAIVFALRAKLDI